MKIKDVPPGSQVYAAIRYPADRGTGKWEGYAIADGNGIVEIDLDVATQTTPIIVQIRDMHHLAGRIVTQDPSKPYDYEIYELSKSEPAQDYFDWFMEGEE
jgi:hypothetical protein